LGAERLGEDVTHVLRLEGNCEGVVELVLGHGCKGNVLRIGEVGLGGSVNVS
jgi:hypothetical protein